MSEKSIIMSGESVCGIFAGRKTQTRRVHEKARYAVGDILWVKEGLVNSHGMILYGANETYYTEFCANAAQDVPVRWKWKVDYLPAIFMPKWACRLWLKVLNVRRGRVQEISNEDLLAEGIEPAECHTGDEPDYGEGVIQFHELWDRLNAKPKPRYARLNGKRVITHYESYPWDEIHEDRTYRGKPWYVRGNPGVFTYEFERLKRMADILGTTPDKIRQWPKKDS